MPDRERLDVVRASAKERRHPVEHPGLVLDEHDEGARAQRHFPASVVTGAGGRRIMSSMSLPGATIG